MQGKSFHEAQSGERVSLLKWFWVEETASLVSPQFVVGAGAGALMVLLAISPLGDRLADGLHDFREFIGSLAHAESFSELQTTGRTAHGARSHHGSTEPEAGCVLVFYSAEAGREAN